jgi:hypothetical protein
MTRRNRPYLAKPGEPFCTESAPGGYFCGRPLHDSPEARHRRSCTRHWRAYLRHFIRQADDRDLLAEVRRRGLTP